MGTLAFTRYPYRAVSAYITDAVHSFVYTGHKESFTMAAENDLGRDDIKKLVVRIAIPSMLAQFVSVLYSIVDRMYIGNIPGSGDMALAGAGVCGPVVTMVGSVAFLVGIGGAPLMSMKMGQGDKKAAERILANCFLMLAVCSILMVACIYPIRIPMLRYFGASDITLPYANAYFSVYLTGTVFALMSTGMNQFIICQGFAKTGMYSVIIGAVLNIALDPVFIFGFHMGVSGAAAATVISQMASCAFVLKTLFGKNMPVRITFGGYSWRLIRRVLTIGFTPFIIIAMDNVMIITMNAILQKYGGAERGDLLITCATIAQSFMLVVTMPLGGITSGTQAVLAYNFGAGKTDRVKGAQKYIFILAAAYTTLLFILARTAAACLSAFLHRIRRLPQKLSGRSGSSLWRSSRWHSSTRSSTVSPALVRYRLPCRFPSSEKAHTSYPCSCFPRCSGLRRRSTRNRCPTFLDRLLQ